METAFFFFFFSPYICRLGMRKAAVLALASWCLFCSGDDGISRHDPVICMADR